MEKRIADLIVLWHGVHVALGKCIESARVVLDQTDRGTLLPDRVREMRGELIATQEMIPDLADLMEQLVDVTVWPMKSEEAPAKDPETEAEPDRQKGDRFIGASVSEPPPVEVTKAEAAGEMAFDAAAVDEEAAAENVDELRVPERGDDVTGTP